MSEHPKVTRKEIVAGALAGAGALALGAASEAQAADEETALFLGQDLLPVPPKNAKVHTSACQYCNVGCGYKIYTWPVRDTPQSPNADGPYPKDALGDWISPTMVTRGSVGGKDSYIAVVPDKDCIVNKGDHSPRGGTNALTVYTKRDHPLTNPQERHLYPQVRDTRGGPLRQVPWEEALERIADAIKHALDNRGPSSIGLWGADHLSPEMNFATTKLFFAPTPRGLYNPALGKDAGVAVRAIHNRPKWNSEHPSLAKNFGSANSLLYAYRDYELADTIVMSGANSYETGTVLYNRMFAQDNKKVVIDPRLTQSARNAVDLGGVHLALRPNTDVVLHQLADERDPQHRQAGSGLHRRALRSGQLPGAQGRRPAGQVQARERRTRHRRARRHRSVARPSSWGARRRRRSSSRRASSGRAPRTKRS